jgi:hypothetical protein
MNRIPQFIALLALVSLYQVGYGQAGQDIVHLKGGSWVRGQVVEKVAGSHVTLLQADGHSRHIPMDSVARLEVMGMKEPFQFKKWGYACTTTMGFWAGRTAYGAEARPSFLMTHGVYVGPKWMVGIGTGIEMAGFDWNLPVCAEGRFHLNRGVLAPFVGVQAGYLAPLTDRQDYYVDFPPYQPEKRLGGLLAGVEVGVRNLVKQHLGYTLSMGYRLQTDNREVQQYFWDGSTGTYITVLQRTTMNRFGIRLGLLFN